MQELKSQHCRKRLKNCKKNYKKKFILFYRLELDRKKGNFGKISGCYYYE